MYKILIGLFLSFEVCAAPFLVSDPYPTTGRLPTSCTLEESGQATRTTPTVINTGEGPHCSWDLANTPAGSHTVTAFASDAWGDSARSEPYTFVKPTAGVPLVVPGGFYIRDTK